MKKISAIFCGLFCVAAVTQAQFKKVPAEVTSAFAASYPTAKNVSWKSGFSSYEASFDLDGDHGEIKYNGRGEWKETRIERKYESLPKEVKEGFSKSRYTDWHIRDTREMREKDRETAYRIYVSKSDIRKHYLYFNSQGKLTKDAITL
ncbi:PepSY-like domain-containing protein [Sediminibacterium soli]|uniref:PepSY-like domain-containing protein n=1 Tax=Sediminibacterium soli TaxID=2698829 RepID=UPI00137B8F45|nr:PepSY-like domain-containing protein [Sediminibacterium soli]NCI47972.1 hypothetical protein [Sediminibacterium soli]